MSELFTDWNEINAHKPLMAIQACLDLLVRYLQGGKDVCKRQAQFRGLNMGKVLFAFNQQLLMGASYYLRVFVKV
ncbi:hypothetical protein [Marinobacterium stanieri]|uniref:hypothetical protein n=1 Tax=Marinobacterium stanieri TaxID=49186 RepID=UPI001111B2BF|nr:hypothetical protein [Marinobacterium stanieri]